MTDISGHTIIVLACEKKSEANDIKVIKQRGKRMERFKVVSYLMTINSDLHPHLECYTL